MTKPNSYFEMYKPALYEESPDDRYYEIQRRDPNDPNENSEPLKRVNMDALAYYARLGVKPKRIGPLIGCSHTTIWASSPLREEYERNAAEHEVWLRVRAMDATARSPDAIFQLLNRAVGTPERDVEAGQNPDEVQTEAVTKIELSIVSNDSPERQSIEEELNRVLRLADKKKSD